MASEHILVVDDQEDIREFIALVLADEGYRVSTAENGLAALEQTAQESVDLVLLDMRMPVMDGWQFAQKYRERPGPHAAIVVLTAAQDAAARAAQIHAEDYLGKPFDLQDLLSMVAQHARGGQR